MGRPLPNLNQLRAFEAAARHLSFKLAAEELHVTQAAVSHQIKALEEDLGTALFRRVTRGVQLLPAARAFAAELTRHFEEMAAAAARLRQGQTKRPLRISSVPAYGMRVLLPRLHKFKDSHPGIEIDIGLELGLTDFHDVDAALRYGRGNWPGVTSRLLHRDIVCPVAAPELVAGRSLPLAPEVLATMSVAISPGAEDDWKAWFGAAGYRGPVERDGRQIENRAVVLDFLLTGSGIGLADLRFAAKELANGQLVRLHSLTVPGVNGIHLVQPKTGIPDARLAAFGDWLEAEAEAMEIADGGPSQA